MLDYIQCTHCGKRYAASDEIREAEGQFTTCQSCKAKFLIVVHTQEPEATKIQPEDDIISTGGWDPSLTMPESESQAADEEDGSEQFLDDDGGTEVLQALQAERKKKQRLYALAGIALVLVLAALAFVLMNDETIVPTENSATTAPTKTAAQVAQSAKVQDANSMECRQAAAQQWMIDYRAMHSNYSGDEFVRILKMSEQQTEKVHKFCQSKTLIEEMIKAATVKEKPDWLKAEIKVLQDSRNR